MSKVIKAIAAVAQDRPMEIIEVQRRDVRPNDVEFDVLYCIQFKTTGVMLFIP